VVEVLSFEKGVTVVKLNLNVWEILMSHYRRERSTDYVHLIGYV
jgi:hypothetical protein